MTIFGAVGAMTIAAVARQQRVSRGAAEAARARRQLREGGVVIAALLEPLSPTDGDILLTDPHRLRFLTTVTVGVACAVGDAIVDLAPVGGANVAGAWEQSPPGAGDTLLVHAEATVGEASTGSWTRFAVEASSEIQSLCSESPWIDPRADAGRPRRRVTVRSSGASRAAGIRPGSAVRVTRPAELSLYRATDGWYLGYAEFDGAWATRQPVSGPYRGGPARSGQAGVTFIYYDSDGRPVVDAALASRIVRIDVLFRAARSGARNVVTHASDGVFADSALVRVALRNAP